MRDVEQAWVVAAGVLGLICFAGGAMAAKVPAVAKILTVLVEVAGTGRRHGWNAGGWAYGTSGYATVAWFALVLVALA